MSAVLLSLLSQPMWVFLSVLARVSPPLMMAPPTHSSSVPKRVRAAIAIGMAALVAPLAFNNAAPMPSDLLHIALALACEVLLGIAMGSVMLLAVTCLQLAGQSIGNLAGFDIATSADPSSDEELPVISNMLGWLAMAIFVILGGHRQLLDCCMQSFSHFPAGMVRFQTLWLEEIDAVMRHTFVVGIRAAAPLATALLLANLVSALLGRTLPQLNILAIGFNINAMALLMLLFLAVGSVAWIYQQELVVWLDACQRMASLDS